MKVRFRTGELAKLYEISKQTLIYYDKIGLFRPAETDPDSGYRFYALEQCELLDVILSLKNLGMPLKEIKSYLALEDTTDRIAMLEAQEEVVERRLAEIERARQRLGSMITVIRERMTVVPFEKGVRRLDGREMFSVEIHAPYDHYQVELAIKRGFQDMQEDYCAGLHGLVLVVDYTQARENLFRKIALYVEGQGNDRFEAGEYAYYIHKGRYVNIPNSTQRLLEYIGTIGRTPVGSFYENVLMDAMAVSREDDAVVEILVRLEE